MYTNEDLEPYVSANDANVIALSTRTSAASSPAMCWTASRLIVNTDLIGDIKIEGYEDLLAPALKGKIATADPANSSAFAHPANMPLAMGGYEDDKAWQYVHDLFEKCGRQQDGESSAAFTRSCRWRVCGGSVHEGLFSWFWTAHLADRLHEGRKYCLPFLLPPPSSRRKEHGQCCQAVH